MTLISSKFCLEKLTILTANADTHSPFVPGNAGGALRPVHPGAYSGREWAGRCQEGRWGRLGPGDLSNLCDDQAAESRKTHTPPGYLFFLLILFDFPCGS